MDAASPNRIPALAGLRGVAALWVCGYHMLALRGVVGGFVRPPGMAVLAAGWAGVDLFFMLSGFVLMHGHGDGFARPSPGEVTRFLRRRARRLYPAHLAVLLLVVAMVLADPAFRLWYAAWEPGNLTTASLIKTALLATNWGLPVPGAWNQPVWSLSLEMIGYAGFPPLARAALSVRSRRDAILAILLCLGAIVGWQAAAGEMGVNAIDGFGALLRMAGGFAAGLFLQRLARLGEGRTAGWATPAGLAAVGALLLLTLAPKLECLMPFAFAALILSLYFHAGPVHAMLASRPARLLGAISYPLYLVQVMPIFAYAFHARRTGLTAGQFDAGLIPLFVGLLAIAAIVHIAVERPFATSRSGPPAGRRRPFRALATA